MEVGAIADVPRAPQPLWTVTLRDLVPGWSEGGDPTLGDVAAVPHALPGFRGVGIGGVLILGLGSIVEDHLVGIDAMTGAVLWHIGPDGVDGRQTSTCVGESPDHLVVCTGRSDSGEPQIQLLDPATGRLARTIPLGFDAHSIGVSGHLLMAHGLVTGFDPNGTHSATLAGGPLVDITGRRLDVPDVWNHPAPGRMPIFASAEPGGSATGQRTDTFDAVDPLDGTQLWSVDTLSATAVGVIGDAVVVRDADHVSLLDQRTGAVRWVVPGDVVGFDGNHLLVVTRDATTDVPTFTLTSVEIAKGSARWSAPAPRGYLVTVGDQILAIDDTSLTGFGR